MIVSVSFAPPPPPSLQRASFVFSGEGEDRGRGESAPSSGSSAAKTWGVNELPTSESVPEGPQELLVLLEVQDPVPVQVEKLCQFMRTWLFRF